MDSGIQIVIAVRAIDKRDDGIIRKFFHENALNLIRRFSNRFIGGEANYD